MGYIKLFHILFMVIWMGTLLTLTRLLGYHVKLDEKSQLLIAKTYKRIYNFVDIPTMVLTILFGLLLLTTTTVNYTGGWFHLKMTLVACLVIADIVCGKWIQELVISSDMTRGIKYKILHGVTGLLLIGILYSVYVMHVK